MEQTNNKPMHFTINYVPWNIEAETGYKPLSTFWMDFSIADAFGFMAVMETFENSVKYAGEQEEDGYKYLTELALVLNHKIFQHWHSDKPADAKENALGRLYDKMWRGVDDFCREHLTGEELTYYYETTD